MFKDIPQVIRETFWKHLLLSAGIVGFGIIWSVIASDRILSLLTGTIALLSAVRLASLYPDEGEQEAADAKANELKTRVNRHGWRSVW